jgi:hypothetical protein
MLPRNQKYLTVTETEEIVSSVLSKTRPLAEARRVDTTEKDVTWQNQMWKTVHGDSGE